MFSTKDLRMQKLWTLYYSYMNRGEIIITGWDGGWFTNFFSVTPAKNGNLF